MEAIILLVAQYLPEILTTAPKVGLAIHDIFSQNADALPDEVKAQLADVKTRQAVEDAEWRADLAPADVAAPATAAADPGSSAALKAQAAEILRLTNELAAARQAGYGVALGPDGADLPSAPEPGTESGGPDGEGGPPA